MKLQPLTVQQVTLVLLCPDTETKLRLGNCSSQSAVPTLPTAVCFNKPTARREVGGGGGGSAREYSRFAPFKLMTHGLVGLCMKTVSVSQSNAGQILDQIKQFYIPCFWHLVVKLNHLIQLRNMQKVWLLNVNVFIGGWVSNPTLILQFKDAHWGQTPKKHLNGSRKHAALQGCICKTYKPGFINQWLVYK